jgi:hypothetical protein
MRIPGSLGSILTWILCYGKRETYVYLCKNDTLPKVFIPLFHSQVYIATILSR